MDYIKLIGGLVLLVLSGDYLVKGGVGIATKFKISSLVIGMTVVAFGTSAPELIVSLQAAIHGSSAIAIGNVVGSNIANIALILGVTAIVSPLIVSRNSVRKDWPFMMFASLLFTAAAYNGIISRIEGFIGFALLIAYTAWQIISSRRNYLEGKEEEETENIAIWKSALMIIAACIGLSYGAEFLISGASNIAKSLGVSERVIGVTIVAFGTSLPELAASVAAALKKETDIAIGNIIGSNIFNILSVIGLSSIISPIPVEWSAFCYDFRWMNAIALVLIILIIPIRQYITSKGTKTSLFTEGKLGRIGGVTLLLLYCLYIFLLLTKG